MNITIGKSRAVGIAVAPPSKSYAHRLLIAAALAEGESVIRDVAFSDDIEATLSCLRALGAEVDIEGSTVRVRGTGGKPEAMATLPCFESGSTLRFLVPVALLGGDAEFSGTERLMARGVDVYRETLRDIQLVSGKRELFVHGTLAAGHYRMRGDVSSQFISGMLFALPCLEGDSVLEILPPFESREYVDITLDVLARFGVEIERENALCYRIRGGQRYLPQNTAVEGDHSNAAFLLALSALGGDVRVTGLSEDSKQGDRVAASLLATLAGEDPVIDLADCPDLAPMLFAVAAAENGARFTGTRRLAIKESSRAEAMAAELSKLGITARVLENEVLIEKGTLHAPTVPIFGHGDHRIVMAMTLLLTLVGGKIEGAEAVRKSYPDFFEVLHALGIEVFWYGMEQE